MSAHIGSNLAKPEARQPGVLRQPINLPTSSVQWPCGAQYCEVVTTSRISIGAFLRITNSLSPVRWNADAWPGVGAQSNVYPCAVQGNSPISDCPYDE